MVFRPRQNMAGFLRARIVRDAGMYAAFHGRQAKENAAVQVNNGQLPAHWNIGRVLVGHEQASGKKG